jgi:hypothetical protein
MRKNASPFRLSVSEFLAIISQRLSDAMERSTKLTRSQSADSIGAFDDFKSTLTACRPVGMERLRPT